MNEFIKQLSSYKIFNYLIPGVIYVIIIKQITSYNFIQEDIFIGLVLYYFIGMTISRVGSLIIEPLFKKVKFVIFEPYDKYYAASQKDSKVLDRLEEANSFRTYMSVFICSLATMLMEYICSKLYIDTNVLIVIVVSLLFIIYAFAYRKQISLLVKRIKATNKNKI